MSVSTSELAAALDGLLPQTQCRQCGYPACRPYAEAIARGDAGINQCPPGGDAGARELARVAGVPYQPVDTRFGVHKPPAVAVIDEAACIGCTLCILACPVDAIVGAARRMHTVIAAECTGCELCLAPCPVDCISLDKVDLPADADVLRERSARARERFERRTARLAGRNKRRSAQPGGRIIDRQVLDDAIARARRRLAEHAIVKK